MTRSQASLPFDLKSCREWLRRNLFNSGLNTVLTLLSLGLFSWLFVQVRDWVWYTAQWEVIQANWRLFLIGHYPAEESWRLNLVLVWLGLTGISLWGWKRYLVPILLAWAGNLALGFWLIDGGLVLTLLMAITSIILSFPLGVGLALGRQSHLPVLRWVSTIYIELIRGLPLIGILFISLRMLKLALPIGIRPDETLRAVIGLTMFSAAYLAENVRGGLQAVPPGQIESARSLGLSSPLVMLLIVLPQALRIAVPAIIGQFIGLFKNTTLLSLVSFVELLGISRSILAQPEFLGRTAEVLLFIGCIYWVFCYGLSWVGRWIERRSGY